MRFTISGKNIDVTEGLKAAVTDKLGKLEKYFTPDTEIIVTLSVEKERQKIRATGQQKILYPRWTEPTMPIFIKKTV